MFRADRCFLCAWGLLGTKGVQGHVRRTEPEWHLVALCGTCAKKVREQGEALVFKNDEWLTVRVRDGMDEVVDNLAEGFR